MDNQEIKQPTEQERRLFEACKRRARSHGFIPLFIIFGIPLLIGLIFVLCSASSAGNTKGAFIAIGVAFMAVGLALLLIAIILKTKRNNAVRYVDAWYKRYPEDKPKKAEPVKETVQIGTANEIRELKKLLDEGIITQEEFDAKKQQLLK